MFTKGGFDILLIQETRSDGSDKEIKKWQKIFNCKQIFLTSYGTRAVGTGIIVRNPEVFKVLHHFEDPEGRYVGIVGDHEEGKFLVLSFYSPSIASEIKTFVIDQIYARLDEMGEDLPEFLILGGDTNTVFNTLDKEGGNQNQKIEAINAFESLKEKFSLIDTYRVKNPNKKEFSWEVTNPKIIRERIDMIFISNSLQDFVAETGIIPVHKTCSDHGIPFIKIVGFGIPTRGPGLWKFNNQLLSDQGYISEMEELIPQWILEAERDLPGKPGEQWGFIKHKIGEFSRKYGAKMKKAKLLVKKQIELELQKISADLNEKNKLEYLNLQDKLNEIIENEVKGAILRSLCDEYEKGEKCSKYFFSLEKYRAKQKTISCLKSEDGSLISDQKQILNECRLFYEKLYCKNSSVDISQYSSFFLNGKIPKLNETQKQNCEANITEKEINNTLKSFRKNKSPGLDGLTAEFYLGFWDLLNVKLLQVYNEAFEVGILPRCMRTGVVTLLEKKGKDRLEIANWRPITLLNLDYKLLTKTLGHRLKKVLPGLIGKEQNGFVPGGSIFFSAHTIRDLLFYCKKENLDLILLALDYSKAFDSLDFEFIFKTFETFNFGDNFKKWIKILYTGGKSCISNNGNISQCFDIERSTRQGDPISPLVFILGLEILLIAIRSDENIQGIKVENNELKMTAFADDASYFLKNKHSAEILLNRIERFSKTSGLEVNRSKSECLLLSFEMNLNIYQDKFLGIPIVDNLKILGHYYGKNEIICSFQNFYSKLDKMAKILNLWKQRNLTLMGKNLLINSLSNSLFVFNAQVEVPPVGFMKLVEKINKDFLWGGTPKIAHHALIANYERGGIKYKDLNDFIASTNVKFVQNLRSSSLSAHSVLPNYWIKKLFKIPTTRNADHRQDYFCDYFADKLNILDCKFKLPRKIKYKGHPFYYLVLKTLEKLTEKTCLKLESLLSTPIWYNRFLKTQFDIDISRAGFNFLKDLFVYGQPCENLGNLTNYKCRKLRSISNHIPDPWVNIIRNSTNYYVTVQPNHMINLEGSNISLKNLTSEQIYRFLITDKIRWPQGLLRWREEVDISDSDIKLAFLFARSCTMNVFDQVFQYKILTKILPTNKYLKQYRVLDSDLCSRCRNFQDTIVHATMLCQALVPYLSQINVFLRISCGVKEQFTLKGYIFGYRGNDGLNCILLQLKKYFFFNKNIDLNVEIFREHFLGKIRKLIIKEKAIMIASGKFDKFVEKWEQFTAIYDFFGPDLQLVE